MYRFNSRSTFSPYFRGNLGSGFQQPELDPHGGALPDHEGQADLVVYDDDHESRVEPAFALGVGFTAAVAPGYQLRWEIRDNIAGMQTGHGRNPSGRRATARTRLRTSTSSA